MTASISLVTPPGLRYRGAVESHGWAQLAPFAFDRENGRLRGVFGTPAPVAVVIYEEAAELVLETDAALDADAKAAVERAARRTLRLDDDLGDFYRRLRRIRRLARVESRDAARLLRSPTVYEDVVKTLCTTNCSWALTKMMVANLVEKLGAADAAGRRAFPTPAAMAGVGEEFYRTEIRAGYRAPYFAELAERVAAGRLDPERWLVSELPTKELKKEMTSIKGFGDYAAENLLKLVGRYDGLALDSWLRAQFYKKHNRAAVCPDRRIAEFYEQFGQWRGLAIWCDMADDED